MAAVKLSTLAKLRERTYDIGNKVDYLKATVEYALKRENLGEDFKKYLKERI